MAIDDNTSYELTGYQVKDLAQKIRAKADSSSLASVATSGLYSDLTGKPSIPTVYNGTLTIQQNGTTLGTFSANQDTNETINIAAGGEPIGFQWDGSDMKDADNNAATGADVTDAFISSGAMITCYDLYGSYTDYASGIVIQGMQETNPAQTETFLVQFSDPTTGNVLHRKFHYDPTASPKWSVDDVTVQSKLTAGTNITISGDTISATDTTYSDFTGATSGAAGTSGLVPQPAAGDQDKYLKADGTWATVQGGGTMTTFYWSGPDSALYKDSGLSIAATISDVGTAASAGPVRIYHANRGIYEYLVTDYISVNNYFSTVYATSNGNMSSVVYFYDSNTWSRTTVGIQKALTAGTNVSISGSTISATDTTYSAGTGISIDANNVISATGGGTSATIFYLDDDFGLAPHIYTDSGRTTYATATDINNAVDAGPVIISDGSYCAEITAFNKTGGMANTGQWEFVYSPDAYVFSFVDNTSIVWDTLPYQSKLTAGTGININASDVISAPAMTGAAASTAGSAGIVPAPAAGDQEKVLHGDGTWKDTTAKLVEMSYGESGAWAKFISAYNAGSIVYCRASSNSNPATGSQTRKAFMAYVNNAATPTEVEFQYVRSVSSKTSSQPVDQVFVYKLTSSGGGTWTVQTRDMAPKIAAGTGINVSYSNGTYTISLASTEGQGGASD